MPMLSRIVVACMTRQCRRHGPNKRLLQHGRVTAIGIDYVRFSTSKPQPSFSSV